MTRKKYNKKNITKKKKMKGGFGEILEVPGIIDKLGKIAPKYTEDSAKLTLLFSNITLKVIKNEIIVQELMNNPTNYINVYHQLKQIMEKEEQEGTTEILKLCKIFCNNRGMVKTAINTEPFKSSYEQVSGNLGEIKKVVVTSFGNIKQNTELVETLKKNFNKEDIIEIIEKKIMEIIDKLIDSIKKKAIFNDACFFIESKSTATQPIKSTDATKSDSSSKPNAAPSTSNGNVISTESTVSSSSNLYPATSSNSTLASTATKLDVTVDERITVIDLMKKIVDKFSDLKQITTTLLKQSDALKTKSPEAATALGQLGKKIDAEKNIVKETIEKIELFIEIFGNQHIIDAFNSIDTNLDTEQIVIIKNGEANKVSTFSCLYNKDCFVDHIGNEPEGTDKENYKNDKYAKFEYLIDNRNIMSDDLRSKFLLLRKLFNDNDKIKSQKGKLKDLCNMKNEIKEKLLGFLNSISEPMQKIRGDIQESQEILNVVDEVLKTFIEIQKLIEVKIKMIDTEIPQLKVACIIFRKWSILNNIPDDNSKESTAFEKMGCLIASTERACDYKLKGGKGKKTQKRSRSKRHK